MWIFAGIFAGTIVKGTIYMDDKSSADVDNLLNDNVESIRKLKFKNKRIQEELKYLIKLADKKGAFKYEELE